MDQYRQQGSMASLIKALTILAVFVSGTAAEPLKVFKKASRTAGPVYDAGMVANHASVTADGILALEAKVDIHALLDLLQQIPYLKETVIQLAEDIRTMKDSSGLSEIEHDLEQIKIEVMRSVNLVESNVEAAVEHSREEELKSIANLLQTMFNQTTNATSTCDQTIIKGTTSQVSNVITNNNKNLEKLINKLIGSELSQLTTAVNSNGKLLTDIDRVIHGEEGHSFGSGVCDDLPTLKDAIKTEMNEVKGLVNNIIHDVTLKVETVLKTEKTFYGQRLDSLEALLKEALKEMAFLANKTQEIAAKQDQYFNSAVEEQVEMVKVVKKTHHYVKQQAQTANNAAARIEAVAARTLVAGRNMGCQPRKSLRGNTLDTNESI